MWGATETLLQDGPSLGGGGYHIFKLSSSFAIAASNIVSPQ